MLPCFASAVTSLFLDTYGQVDPPTRTKMEEMLITWCNDSHTRNKLFGTVNQTAIERGVWGNDSGSAMSCTPSELQFGISAKKRALHLNPYDTDTQRKTEALHQVSSTLTLLDSYF